MQQLELNNVVIGGSGPSLMSVDYTKLPDDYFCIRVNNFFFEDTFYLGKKIDLVVFSGDKRALRFYVKTLNDVIKRDIYSIHSVASQSPYAGRYNYTVPFEKIVVQDDSLRLFIDQQQRKFQKKISSGLWAVIKAYELGAKNIYLCGIDFYQGPSKYFYDFPPNYRRLMLPNLEARGYDTIIHNWDLDKSILEFISAKVSVHLSNTHDSFDSAKTGFMKSSQDPFDFLIKKKNHEITSDWIYRDGIHTIGQLAAARVLRRWLSHRS